MRRATFPLAIALLLSAFAAAPLPAAEPVELVFLHFNDLYEIAPRRGKGGFAPLATLLEEERRDRRCVFTTFGGDLLSPSVLSGLTRGAQMIELANAVGIDFAVPGNHEFDFGPEVAARRFADSRFPWLAANMLDETGRPALGTRATAMTECGGYRIGFLGLVTPATAELSSPGAKIRFEAVVAVARREVERLRAEGADFVVALTHQDFAADRVLLAEVPGIDLVLGGHDHDPMSVYEGGRLLVKAGYDAHYLAVVEVALREEERRGRKRLLWTPQWRFRSTAGIAPEPAIDRIVQRWNRRLDEELDVAVGTTEVELDTRRATVRSRESNFGNLVADAMRAATGAEIAITNGGGIRGDRTYPPGTVVTRKDILTELPFGNVTVLLELTGADILEALENGVSQVEKQAGRFPQVSGLSFTFDPRRPAGQRVVAAKVGDAPLDPGRRYRVATNDYLLKGGDGYAMFARGRVLLDPSAARLMATAVIEHIEAAGGRIAPGIEGRIRRVE